MDERKIIQLPNDADDGPGSSSTASPPATVLLDADKIFAPLPPVNYLCEPFDMAPGAPTLIAGYGFSGKTVAAQDFALAVATGGLAWGAFRVRAGRVLHLDYEQGAHLTRLRYQRLARARGIEPAALQDRLALAVMPPFYLDDGADDALERLCDGFDLVIVDSLRAACPRTDENSSEARIPLDRLTRLSEKTGVLPLVVHHARKPSSDSRGGARMSVRGSGALYDASGSMLVFAAEKNEPVAVSHEKARISGRLHPDFGLWVEDVEVDGDLRGGLRVSRIAAPAEDGKRAPVDRLARVKERIVTFLREKGPLDGGVTALRALLGGRQEDISVAVSELVKGGVVVRGGTSRPTLSLAGGT